MNLSEPVQEPLTEIPEPSRRQAVLEALLFLSSTPMRVGELCEICQWGRELLERDLERLAESLQGRGIELQRVAGAVRLVTSPAVAPYAERMLKVQSRKRLTRSQLETLAVVAYRQPATRAQVEAYRGVKCERALSQLLELRLIREVGRAPLPGRPCQYGTTAEFLRHFGLNDLSQLPALEPDRAGDAARTRGPFAALELDQGQGDSTLQRVLARLRTSHEVSPSCEESLDSPSDSQEPLDSGESPSNSIDSPTCPDSEEAPLHSAELEDELARGLAPLGADSGEEPAKGFQTRRKELLDTPSEELRRLFDRIRRRDS
ncbi:MAG: SMC-Scp complex subunit ScpB [Candidatus Eremiobacterota bacterium]